MLTVCTSATQVRTRISRRQWLRIGTTTLGGLSLSHLLAARAAGASLGNVDRDRCVVFLNLQGGPSQFETFDPKMTAPSEIRSITGQVSTTLPGVTFGGTLPRLAALAGKTAIVRTYRHGISDHGRAAMHVMAGGNATGAMMGALYSRVVGLTDAATGLPQNTLVTPRAASTKFKDLYANIPRVSQTGSLPSIYKPFDPSAGGQILQNMRLAIPQGQLDNRRVLLQQLDQLRRRLDRHDALAMADEFQQQALDVLMRGVADAFDLSQEDPRTVHRYDTSQFAPTDAVRKRNEYAAQFSPVALGMQMLLARRLCEAGCGFVTVTCGGWDMHGGGKEFTMSDGIASLTPALDKAVSAFISDVYDRGLDDTILLVIAGEFGRTPRINKNGGRDHWGHLCPLMFVGGGLKMGQVVGQSDRTASHPASSPISSDQVLSTIMHSLFDIGQLRLLPGIPNDVMQAVTGGEPIRELT